MKNKSIVGYIFNDYEVIGFDKRQNQPIKTRYIGPKDNWRANEGTIDLYIDGKCYMSGPTSKDIVLPSTFNANNGTYLVGKATLCELIWRTKSTELISMVASLGISAIVLSCLVACMKYNADVMVVSIIGVLATIVGGTIIASVWPNYYMLDLIFNTEDVECPLLETIEND